MASAATLMSTSARTNNPLFITPATERRGGVMKVWKGEGEGRPIHERTCTPRFHGPGLFFLLVLGHFFYSRNYSVTLY